MATEEAKDNKKLILGIVGAVAAIAVIVVVAVVILKNRKPVLNDDFFKSDGSKLVITIDGGSADTEGAVKQHQVYDYKDDTITGFKNYIEFENADTAKKAYDAYKQSGEATSSFKSIDLDGKYIIMTVPEEQYKDLTTSAVRSYIELFESIKNAALEEDSNKTEGTTEDTTETTEEGSTDGETASEE